MCPTIELYLHKWSRILKFGFRLHVLRIKYVWMVGFVSWNYTVDNRFRFYIIHWEIDKIAKICFPTNNYTYNSYKTYKLIPHTIKQ